MTANLLKSKAPDLSAAPEEFASPEVNDRQPGAGALPQSRSGLSLHLQEKLLSCGNHSAFLDNEDRRGRRPSAGSLYDSSMIPNRENEGGGYCNMKRVQPC